MQKKLKLKPFVLPSIYLTALVLLVLGIFFTTTTLKSSPGEEDITYVSNAILGGAIPVISEETKIMRPYNDSTVTIAKYFYDYQGEQSRQENSLIYHENTYMQNSGMDFTAENTFDVVAILDGTVIRVKEDELLGNIIEVRHDNEVISVYQSLSEVNVKKDDVVKQGQVLGKSGTNRLDESLKNHLHFELFVKGAVVDPELYFDKTLGQD